MQKLILEEKIKNQYQLGYPKQINTYFISYVQSNERPIFQPADYYDIETEDSEKQTDRQSSILKLNRIVCKKTKGRISITQNSEQVSGFAVQISYFGRWISYYRGSSRCILQHFFSSPHAKQNRGELHIYLVYFASLLQDVKILNEEHQGKTQMDAKTFCHKSLDLLQDSPMIQNKKYVELPDYLYVAQLLVKMLLFVKPYFRQKFTSKINEWIIRALINVECGQELIARELQALSCSIVICAVMKQLILNEKDKSIRKIVKLFAEMMEVERNIIIKVVKRIK